MATIPSAAAPASGFKWMFFSLEGRAARSNWWIWGVIGITIASVVARFIAGLIDMMLGTVIDPGIGILTTIVNLALFYPAVCISGKRWHDRNKSAWWNLLWLIPALLAGPLVIISLTASPGLAHWVLMILFIGVIWTLVECGFLRGTVGENRFGPDPLAGK
jgi:uncharacterized membrane protein YhaH (DUF805 family)